MVGSVIFNIKLNIDVMSARVFNPLVMSEMPRMFNTRVGNNNNSDSTTGRLDGDTLAKVKRCLFGTPNSEDVHDFVEKELASMRKRDSERWNFDFDNERPLNSVNGRYIWERIPPQKYIPKALRFEYISQNVENTLSAGGGDEDDVVAEEETLVVRKNVITNQQKTSTRNTKQSRITDYLKNRKRSFSAGDLVTMKKLHAVAASSGSFSTAVSPSTRKCARTRNS